MKRTRKTKWLLRATDKYKANQNLIKKPKEMKEKLQIETL
jgi:hypothetical protein